VPYPGMPSAKPWTSILLIGAALAYAYVFTPASNPIGSLSTYLPMAGS
jgi:hypothetical protein